MNSEFKRMKKLFLFSVALMSLFLFSCEDDPKNARIEVWLTDLPGDYQQVNVDIEAVEVHSSEMDDDKGWQSVPFTPNVYNLLDFTNGNDTLLGSLDLPGGRISQIRLKLGDENTVMDDSVLHDLVTPSGQQSGVKIQINQVLVEGITYKILLDFEAGKSVVKTGSDKYLLKPVIRAMTTAQDGAIKGSVIPPGIVAISLMAGDSTVTTTSSNEGGDFLIRGLDPGIYKLVFDVPDDTTFVEKPDVNVELGAITDVGEIQVGQ